MKNKLVKASAAVATFMAVGQAFAEGSVSGGNSTGWIAMAAALVLGIAAFAGAQAQGRIGAAAMDGIARNPNAQSKMFVSMIIGLALIESLVIYALVIGFQLVGKI